MTENPTIGGVMCGSKGRWPPSRRQLPRQFKVPGLGKLAGTTDEAALRTASPAVLAYFSSHL